MKLDLLEHNCPLLLQYLPPPRHHVKANCLQPNSHQDLCATINMIFAINNLYNINYIVRYMPVILE